MPGLPDSIKHPRLRQLYDYWNGKRGDRRMPARADLDPLDIRFAIGDVVMADVIDGDPPRFRIRLHGTNLAERTNFDLTGKMLDDMPAPEFRELVTRSFRKVIRSHEPLHALAERLLDDRMQHYEAIILPLSRDGERVDRLMVGMIFEPPRR
ncbi:MAG TPA: PAS domain-containing protein [Stellaceae bacterium]|nr:PAS domain-containing protein [Stellaceae bacterium]